MTDNSEVLNSIIKEIKLIDDMSIRNGVSLHSLEFDLPKSSREFIISGNVPGLIYLAKSILELAASGVQGSHVHLDEVGIVDRCDLPLVIRLSSVGWGD